MTRSIPAILLPQWVKNYSCIAIIANNPNFRLSDAQRVCSANTLFVFFNNAQPLFANKKRFDEDVVLCCRSTSRAISGLARSRNRFIAENFLESGRLRLWISFGLSPEIDLIKKLKVPHLGVVDLQPRYYGRGTPSTGFLTTRLFVDNCLNVPIHLFGFTGQSGPYKKMMPNHDWIYEQLYLKFAEKIGLITLDGDEIGLERLAILREEFPSLTDAEFDLVLRNFVMQRLSDTNVVIDQIRQIIKPLIFAGTIRRLQRSALNLLKR